MNLLRKAMSLAANDDPITGGDNVARLHKGKVENCILACRSADQRLLKAAQEVIDACRWRDGCQQALCDELHAAYDGIHVEPQPETARSIINQALLVYERERPTEIIEEQPT